MKAKNPPKTRNKTVTAHAAHIVAGPKAEFLTDDKMTHLICNTYFFLDTVKNKKANASDPSEVRGNITIIFKRIKTDPQILFSILMSNLIAIMRIKSLGSLLRWLHPKNSTVKNLQLKFSFYSFKKKIHCCLDRQGYIGFLSWLSVPAVNCPWGKWQPLPRLLLHRHQWVSGRLELLNDP